MSLEKPTRAHSRVSFPEVEVKYSNKLLIEKNKTNNKKNPLSQDGRPIFVERKLKQTYCYREEMGK